MSTTYFPYYPSHIWSSAGWVVNAVNDTTLSPEVVAAVKKWAYAPAERLRAAREKKTSLQGAHKLALAALNAANKDNDDAGSAVAAAAGIKGGRALQDKVQLFLGGRRMSDVTGAPHEEEIRVFADFLSRVDADPDKFELPVDRIETLRGTNAAHEAAYLAERAAYKALRAAVIDYDDASDEFLSGYRASVRTILLELGEAGAAAVLPTFEGRSKKDDDE